MSAAGTERRSFGLSLMAGIGGAADLLRIHMLHLPLMCCPQSLWQRIEVLIGRADTIVFAISPDAAASEISLKKIAEAASLNKRFAPVVWRWDQKHAKQSAHQR